MHCDVGNSVRSKFHCVISANRYGLLMKTAALRVGNSVEIFFLTSLIVLTTFAFAHADQVDMKNGDHYSGKVTALDEKTVVLESDILGTLRLGREKVAAISFGTEQPTTAATPPRLPQGPPVKRLTAPVAGAPNPNIQFNSSLRQDLAANSNLVAKVQSEVLAGAGPKALKKFDDLIGGLSTGDLNIVDLRHEAESVADQLRQLRSSGDDESGGIFDEYLAVLDSFLQQTKPAVPAKTPVAKRPIVTAKPKPATAIPTTLPISAPKDDEE